MTTTFIYALCEPGTRTVRYIGKTDNPSNRLRQHKNDSVRFDSYLGRWLRSVVACGKFPDMIVLREIQFEDWEKAEERYIRLARGCGIRLVNTTEGGDGVIGISPEVREKLREANLGERNPFFGKTHTEEARKRIGAAQTGAKNHSFGGITSVTALENMSKAHRGEKSHLFGTHLSDEAKENLRRSKLGSKNPMFGKCGASHPMFGRKHSEETRAKMRASKRKAG